MKKALKPAQLWEEADVLEVCCQVSERRAFSVIQLQRSTYRYRSVADEQAAIRVRLRDLAQARVSYGYRRIHILLQREGWKVNHKRVYRLYRLEGGDEAKEAKASCYCLQTHGEARGLRNQ